MKRLPVEKVRKDKFATLDTNKDASLDKAEFFAEAKAKLAAADTDKDGKVTPLGIPCKPLISFSRKITLDTARCFN